MWQIGVWERDEGLAGLAVRLTAGRARVRAGDHPAQLAGELGVDLSALTWGNFLVRNLLPVTLGNVLGGMSLAGLMWYCYRPKREG